jgi:predicted SAM-dependent methyltransferase
MIKINMGCGWRNFGSDWIHIDGGDYPHLDYSKIDDLSQFEDETVDLIYASHVLEYFNINEAQDVLKEWKRVLKIGGTLRIAVPDFWKISKLYSEGNFPLSRFIGPLYGRMDMGETSIYHKHVYDEASLKDLLVGVMGFKEYQRYDWRKTDHAEFDDHSQAYLPHMDKERGTLISLNVECVK